MSLGLPFFAINTQESTDFGGTADNATSTQTGSAQHEVLCHEHPLAFGDMHYPFQFEGTGTEFKPAAEDREQYSNTYEDQRFCAETNNNGPYPPSLCMELQTYSDFCVPAGDQESTDTFSSLCSFATSDTNDHELAVLPPQLELAHPEDSVANFVYQDDTQQKLAVIDDSCWGSTHTQADRCVNTKEQCDFGAYRPFRHRDHLRERKNTQSQTPFQPQPQDIRSRAMTCENAVIMRCERRSVVDIMHEEAIQYVKNNGGKGVHVRWNLAATKSQPAQVLILPVKAEIKRGLLKVSLSGIAARDLKRCPAETTWLSGSTNCFEQAYRFELLFGDAVSLSYLAIPRRRKSQPTC